ncbi:TIGR04013 family B12-binding domain/radical SAM domain-containing protein [Methanocaldococcus sp.]|uniref:TIGR04013 family B12-binding domain/radical SAM domain-containing protein n=1 Tax=Methanocaldococcus sp. TaxID=2152917 RepID=UPI00262542FA|nr:TIGR04013 family B12-binding domain/radical SAM domain-containing protein [Methanocaldococcus sp.]MCQ6254316.1 TIGR04013 family B12-binding domain/radical SAM domain-containing protein [Methanocaldococcus sp.]
MRENTALVVYYTKQHKNSFNALIGALEVNEYFDNFPIYFANKKDIYNLERILKRYDKVIIAISFFTTELWKTYELMKKLKIKYKEYSNKIIYLSGGSHPTGDPKGTLKLGFDVVCIGEGEETFPEFIMSVSENEDYKKVKGICYFEEDKFIYTGKRKPIDLNKYPPFPIKYNKFGHIEITRGCPYKCYFCQTPRIFGKNVRHRSIENICKYVEIMSERNLKDIRFITPNAFGYGSKTGKDVNIDKLENLLKNIKEILGKDGRIFFGTFPSEVRPEHVNDETTDLILKYTYNKSLVIGAQSGSDRVLELCNRGHTVDDIYKAVDTAIKKGINVSLDFIFGLPGETKEDIEKTIKVMKDFIKLGVKIHAHAFIPLPQTPFAKANPGVVDKKIIMAMRHEIPKGIFYGSWHNQQMLAKKISKYLRFGEL